MYFFLFFFHDTATTEIYTLSLHDALPICQRRLSMRPGSASAAPSNRPGRIAPTTFRQRPRRCGGFSSTDRKSTRLNSSHSQISYAVFCLKKKKNKNNYK